MLIGLVIFAYTAICLSLICRKMGFPPLLGLIAIIPYLGSILFIVLLWFMAFARWPRFPEHGIDTNVFR